MNTKIFILSFIIGLPIFIAVDYLAMKVHLVDGRSFGPELIKSLVVALFFAGVMSYLSNRKRKSRAMRQ